MTDLLYLTDSTVRRFRATVERCLTGHDQGPSIVLDRTHFYPTGGGQPNDIGQLAVGERTIEVTDVSGPTPVHHHIPHGIAQPDPGTTVVGRIDWDRRSSLMRYHTAQHLVSAVLLDRFGASTAGNQLYPDRARIDCRHDSFSQSDLEDIESAVNQHIEADHPVTWTTVDRETAADRLDPDRTRLALVPSHVTDIRIVEIGDIDRTACAGTHVQSTGTLGTFTITNRETAGRDRERLHFRLV